MIGRSQGEPPFPLDFYLSWMSRVSPAAHETFSLLATQPNMGWHSRLKNPALASLRVFRVSGFERLLVLYRPRLDGVEILRVVHASRDLEAFLRRDRVE